ncbi:MAG TPA: FAD-binding oxidoreductase [Thermodesulfobacteriota bacterium]|nr:FAD-binding oxidoreductase [Thermodesulfobacteriota bacterium]
MSNYDFDFVFIGGGILGSSGAMALSKKFAERGETVSVAVIDVDLEGEHSSTLKNAGGVRATWRNRANIELCKYSIDFYKTIREEVQFHELGYFWMHDEEWWEEINKNYPIYKEYGLTVELHPREAVTEFLPFVDNLDGIAGLSISRKAGLIDHYSLREHYRKEAKKRGVKFFDGCYVKDIPVSNGRATEVIADKLDTKSGNRSELVKKRLVKEEIGFSKDSISFRFGVLINTAGAWAPRISKLYGFHDGQIKPRKRQMVVMRCSEVDLSNYGIIIDTSDVYFHRDAENILVGYSNMDEPYGYNLEFSFGGTEEESHFTKYIWLPLWNRSSKFERVKFIRGWAGLYAETPDRSGYLGKVPGFKNVYECAAHTGRGLMISYGAGNALSDLIVDGKFREELAHTKDLSRERPSGELFEELHL